MGPPIQKDGTMKTISFDIVKKMHKAAAAEPGVQLSSLKADRASGSAVLTGANNAAVRESVAAFRSLTGFPIGCRARGRSIQVFSEAPELWGGSSLGVLLEFLKGVSFASEDVLDVLEFCGLPAEYGFGTLRLEHIDMDRERMELGATAEILSEDAHEDDAAEILSENSPEDEAAEAVYSELMPVLERYEMGVIKQER